MEPLTPPAFVVLSSTSLYRYELPLAAPLQLGTETWRRRRGLLLRLHSDRGVVGWGEAAPLPGFSPESLDDVVAYARAAASGWIGTDLPEADLERAWQVLSEDAEAPASFRFATESAVVELLAAESGPLLPEVLGTPRSTVPLNALLTDPVENGPEQARSLREQGYRAVKVKVGRAPIEQEIDALRQVRRVLGEGIDLRADANRAWSFDEAVHFAEASRDL
ncbi:MAG: enolase C-terminal domain-like protein, partial [Salinibacter sp.]